MVVYLMTSILTPHQILARNVKLLSSVVACANKSQPLEVPSSNVPLASMASSFLPIKLYLHNIPQLILSVSTIAELLTAPTSMIQSRVDVISVELIAHLVISEQDVKIVYLKNK